MARRRVPKWLEAARAGVRPGEDDRLERALLRAGVVPDALAERYIRSKRVSVNGVAAIDPLSPVKPGDEIRIDGEVVSLAAKTLIVGLHKPAGLVVAKDDPEGKGTVFDLLKQALPKRLLSFGWHAVGRLDRDTTGLLLFTNDECFVEHATSPETHLTKRYVAQVDGHPDEEKLAKLRAGVALGDGAISQPAEAKARASNIVELVLTEGRHHQVRRMLDAVGLPVLALHREAVGGLELTARVGLIQLVTDEEIRRDLHFEPRTA